MNIRPRFQLRSLVQRLKQASYQRLSTSVTSQASTLAELDILASENTLTPERQRLWFRRLIRLLRRPDFGHFSQVLRLSSRRLKQVHGVQQEATAEVATFFEQWLSDERLVRSIAAWTASEVSDTCRSLVKVRSLVSTSKRVRSSLDGAESRVHRALRDRATQCCDQDKIWSPQLCASMAFHMSKLDIIPDIKFLRKWQKRVVAIDLDQVRVADSCQILAAVMSWNRMTRWEADRELWDSIGASMTSDHLRNASREELVRLGSILAQVPSCKFRTLEEARYRWMWAVASQISSSGHEFLEKVPELIALNGFDSLPEEIGFRYLRALKDSIGSISSSKLPSIMNSLKSMGVAHDQEWLLTNARSDPLIKPVPDNNTAGSPPIQSEFKRLENRLPIPSHAVEWFDSAEVLLRHENFTSASFVRVLRLYAGIDRRNKFRHHYRLRIVSFLDQWLDMPRLQRASIDWNSRDLASIIHSLGILAPFVKNNEVSDRLDSFLRMWEESASQIIREWGSQSISTVVQSFSRLGSPTLPFMEAVLTRILTIGFEKLSIIELVNVMYGVSRWTTNRGKRWDEHTWHELSDEISRKLGEASPETLGFLASALINHACISQETCSVLRTRWLSELFVQMDRCSVEQLAHIPLQIARLGVEIPSDGFFRKFYRLFEQKASGFGSVELATMFYWLGRISAKPTNRFLKTWSDRAITAFRPFDEMIFVNSIRAFSLLRRQPDHIFFDFWLREMSQNLGQNSSNAGLALAISSLGKLRLTPGKEFVEAWTRAFESSNREWKAQEYFMMLEGWSKLGMAPPESLLNQIFQFYPEKFLQGSIDSPMLAGILHALGLLDRCPPAEFLSSWCSAASHDGSRFTNQEVSNIVYAFGTLGIAVPKQLFEVEHLQQVARGGSNQEYAVLIHGVAKLSRLAPIPNKGPVLDVSPLLSEFAEIGRKRQATLTLREVLHIGSSFGTEAKRNRLPNFVEDSLFQILRRDMLRLEPKALVSCSHVLGLIGPRVPSELMANWLSRLESHLDTFTSKELSNCILSASSSSFTPSSTFLSRWQFAFQRHSTMKNFDLWMSIEAIYRLRLAPSEDFRSSFFGHLLTNGFTGEKRGRLLHLGHILREMDMPVPQEVAQKWVKSVYELSPPMSTPVQDLPDILRMCNCCGSMTSIVAEYYAKTELILNGLGNLSLSDFVLALEAFGEIHTAIDHNSKIRLSEGIRSQGTRHWQLMDSQQLLSAFRSIVRVDHDFDWLEFWKMTADCLGSLNREEIETFLALANSAGVKAPFALVVRQQYLALETAGNASCPIEVPQSIPSAVPQTDQQRSLEGPAALSQGPLL